MLINARICSCKIIMDKKWQRNCSSGAENDFYRTLEAGLVFSIFKIVYIVIIIPVQYTNNVLLLLHSHCYGILELPFGGCPPYEV